MCSGAFYSVSENPVQFFPYLKKFSYQAVVNASVSVDSFFLLRYAM